MASAVATEHLGSRLYINNYDHDPGAGTAILTSPDGGTTIRYLDMRDYEWFGVSARPTIAGGPMTLLEIVASETVTFSAVTVIKSSGAIVGDALNDVAFLECSAEEIAQLGSDGGLNLRYVAARITQTTSTDEANVTYIGWPRRPRTGLTATVIT